MVGYFGDKTHHELMEVVSLSKNELPCAIIFSDVNKKTDSINKYKYNSNERGKLNEENLLKFVDDWRANKIHYILQSESLPNVAVNQFGVHHIVTNSIDNFLPKDSSKTHSVLLFINKEMQHFEEIRVRFNNLAEKLKSLNLVFGQIDPYLNEIEVIMMKHYPGIALFTNVEKKVEASEYDNPEYKTINLLNFIKSKTNIDVFSGFSELEKLELEKESELHMEKTNEEPDLDLSEYVKGINIKEMLDEEDKDPDADNKENDDFDDADPRFRNKKDDL